MADARGEAGRGERDRRGSKGHGPEDSKAQEPESAIQSLARYSGHGLTLAMATGLFLLVGWWIDGRVGTLPLFTILGAMVGAAAGFYHMLHHVLFLPREREDEERRARESGEP